MPSSAVCPPRETWLWAAILSAGEGAVLSHQTAAELHGLLDPPADAIYVTVPSTRRVATRGLIIRTSGRVEQARQPNRAPPRTSVEETVLDLVQLAPGFDDVCGWITKACAKRLTTEESSGPRWLCARKCAGAPSSMMSSPQRAAEFTPCWNTGTCATSSAPTACRDPGIRCASSSTARWSTGTCTTRSIRSPSSWTDGWPIRTRSAGATAIGTPKPACKGCRRAATAGVTSMLAPARPPCCRRRSCAAGAGEGSRSRAQQAARWDAHSAKAARAAKHSERKGA